MSSGRQAVSPGSPLKARIDTPQPRRQFAPPHRTIGHHAEIWPKTMTTAKARAVACYPPHIPADPGFYDRHVPEPRAAQALERPFDEVLASGQPDLPFCLCWANETWTGIWHGAPKTILIEQT